MEKNKLREVTKFKNIKEMLKGNDFYKDKIK